MEYSDKAPKNEHTYNVYEKRQARRKLMGARAKAAAMLIGLAGAMGVGSALEKAIQPTPEPNYMYSGKIEIVMSNNLNIRESPIITDKNQVPSAIDWSEVKQINGVDITGHESFDIKDPKIFQYQNNDTPWITLGAKVDNGSGVFEDKLLYINFGPETRDYVKIEQHGSFIHLNDSLHPQENLGVVTFNQ